MESNIDKQDFSGLKVSDFVKVSKKSIDCLDELLIELKIQQELYISVGDDDILSLEDIKKKMTGLLVRYSFILAEIKAYKDGNHIYLGERRKLLKSNMIVKMISSGKFNITNAKELVYAQEEYVAKLDFIQKLKKRFIMYESAFDAYSVMLTSIVQSISVYSRSISLSN